MESCPLAADIARAATLLICCCSSSAVRLLWTWDICPIGWHSLTNNGMASNDRLKPYPQCVRSKLMVHAADHSDSDIDSCSDQSMRSGSFIAACHKSGMVKGDAPSKTVEFVSADRLDATDSSSDEQSSEVSSYSASGPRAFIEDAVHLVKQASGLTDSDKQAVLYVLAQSPQYESAVTHKDYCMHRESDWHHCGRFFGISAYKQEPVPPEKVYKLRGITEIDASAEVSTCFGCHEPFFSFNLRIPQPALSCLQPAYSCFWPCPHHCGQGHDAAAAPL